MTAARTTVSCVVCRLTAVDFQSVKRSGACESGTQTLATVFHEFHEPQPDAARRGRLATAREIEAIVMLHFSSGPDIFTGARYAEMHGNDTADGRWIAQLHEHAPG